MEERLDQLRLLDLLGKGAHSMSIHILRYASLLLIMALDILSGVIKTKVMRKKFVSSKMSSGLFKKMGNILCMVVSDLLAVSSHYIIGFDIDIRIAVYVYIFFMECLSIYENCGDSGLIDILKKALERVTNGSE